MGIDIILENYFFYKHFFYKHANIIYGHAKLRINRDEI
jgi:hypothetical protein